MTILSTLKPNEAHYKRKELISEILHTIKTSPAIILEIYNLNDNDLCKKYNKVMTETKE